MEDVINNIKDYFDWIFFWAEYSEKRELIEKKAKKFEDKYPNLNSEIMNNFRENFPHLNIAHTNYFVARDRCISFEVSDNSGKHNYIFGVSIFGYFFMIDRRTRLKKLSVSDFSVDFIDEGSSLFFDVMRSKVLNRYSEIFNWLPGDLLNTTIPELNLVDLDEVLISITVFNCLTSFGVDRTM